MQCNAVDLGSEQYADLQHRFRSSSGMLLHISEGAEHAFVGLKDSTGPDQGD